MLPSPKLRALLIVPVLACGFASPDAEARAAEPIKLLVAFSSYKERPQSPQLYFYEHDGIGSGKLLGGIPPVAKRSDHHPCFSGDGRLCAFASEAEGQPCTIQVFDRVDNKLLDLPTLNDSPNMQAGPTLSLDGRTLIAEAWSRPQFTGRWDLLQYDLARKETSNVPRVNLARGDERHPAISGDGRFLAYVSNQLSGGRTDIALVTWPTGDVIDLPGVNSEANDTEPWLDATGRLLAFASDRSASEGGRDIFLYDREVLAFIPLPGVNTPGQEQSPALSPDGRFLVFVSERLDGAGERDVLLYDLSQKKLLPLPGLNSPRDDFDPCVMVISER